MITVGSVPYINAYPLIYWLRLVPEQIKLVFAPPSQLATMLENGELDAALVSSFHAFQTPGMRAVDGLCIGSNGPVQSVKVFSKVPFSQIERLALDQDSLTSNHLAQILLEDAFGCAYVSDYRPPVLENMLQEFDAGVLIGDPCMGASPVGLQVLDLGEAWKAHWGLPFTWAMWIGGEGLTEEVATWLRAAGTLARAMHDPFVAEDLDSLAHQAWLQHRNALGASVEGVLQWASSRSSWTPAQIERYLTDSVRYSFAMHEMMGLMAFRITLQDHDFPAPHFPALVGASETRVQELVAEMMELHSATPSQR